MESTKEIHDKSKVLVLSSAENGVHLEKHIAVTNPIFSFSDPCNNEARLDSKHAGQQSTKFSRLEL